MSNDQTLASSTSFAFVNALLKFGESYEPHPGDVIRMDYSDLTPAPGNTLPTDLVTVVSVGKKTVVVRSKNGKRDHEVMKEGHFSIVTSPTITEALEKPLRQAVPDGIAFSDACVPPPLRTRLRRHVTQLAKAEPVDYHPGSGTRVRDLVHPSLYPYVAKVSKVTKKVAAQPKPERDRFGRVFESSRYQWLPTPFQIARDGTTRIEGTINNLDPEAYAPLYEDLAQLFSSALPLIESVLGYVAATRFWQQGEPGTDDESDLPKPTKSRSKLVPRRSVRGRELLVIPKIVDYELKAGEVHEGVWHVEGMSHEHIVATCVYVLDRDDCLQGGDLSFKRAYTLEEAGRVFWTINQSRPAAIDTIVEEGTIPLGSVATPAGRVLVFPNSHIHRLDALTVGPRAKQGRRRVIVFWIVDPDVPILSTREVPPQQGVMSRPEALKIRLALMEERRRHKASFNVRAVSLCEH